ncbi:ABC transporter ATP-binding protein [bacterium]|nr:ABC transporter ATP-binding protein [bacterium]
MNNSMIIKTRDLHKSFKRGEETVHALNGVSLDIKQGEFLSIVGSSGSGKTTFLNIISCLDKPTTGSLLIEDLDVSDFPEKKLIKVRRDHFGFIFQYFFLIPTLTVSENIQLPLMFAGKKKSPREITALLTKIGLEKRMHHLPGQLSGGEMQRVAIARAMINDPKIIIADEPTGNLDSTNSQLIFDLFRQLNKELGVTIICATHNLDLANQSDRIVHLKDGKVLDGPVVCNV